MQKVKTNSDIALIKASEYDDFIDSQTDKYTKVEIIQVEAIPYGKLLIEYNLKKISNNKYQEEDYDN